jgi:hypothetical protein
VADAYPLQNPRTAWRVYDGEAVILCSDDSMLSSLNAVATLIWESADGKTPVSAIVDNICAQFDVDRERAWRDAAAFIDTLRERGLVTVAGTIPAVP